MLPCESSKLQLIKMANSIWIETMVFFPTADVNQNNKLGNAVIAAVVKGQCFSCISSGQVHTKFSFIINYGLMWMISTLTLLKHPHFSPSLLPWTQNKPEAGVTLHGNQSCFTHNRKPAYGSFPAWHGKFSRSEAETVEHSTLLIRVKSGSFNYGLKLSVNWIVTTYMSSI